MGGFFGAGASVDLASPPAIGNTTPNTGAFTTLSANNGTITTSSPAFTLAQTWNAGAQTFTALRVNATDTASASGSLLMDLQVGGASKLNIRKDGSIIVPNTAGQFPILSWPVNGSIECGGLIRADARFRIGPGANLQIDSGGVNTTGSYQFSASNATSAGDVVLVRDAADTFAQRRTTNAQTFRLYRTFTDASNYERLGFIATRTTRFAIAAENAGTGTARSLEISFYTSASDPASTDITDGCFSVWKNSGTGTIKLWANDGGTMKSVGLA